MQKKQYIVECAKYSVASEIFIYNRKDIATEVFEVLCTVSTGNERITLSEKNGEAVKVLKEARI